MRYPSRLSHRVAVLFQILCLTSLLAIPATVANADQALDARLLQAKNGKRAVMLELGSVGCIPCEQMRPVMEKLSNAYKDRLDVIFVDVRKDGNAARKFGVYGIPAQVFLDKNGKEFHRHIGYYPYEQIVLILKKADIQLRPVAKKE
ncbi:MAG TPA: thioredoxin family protein [Dissulfurispiraceae bacterium]|nr:thioredoxin family protein [Dissulfurispiraceae bacterium]